MTALLLCNALLEVLFAAVVLRADSGRRESRLISIAALLDAGRSATQRWLLSIGFQLTSQQAMQADLIGRILLVFPALEFVYCYPLERRSPFALRAFCMLASSAFLVCALQESTAAWADHWFIQDLFFVPFFAIMLWAARRNLMRVHTDERLRGARRVLLVVGFLYAVNVATYGVLRPIFPASFSTVITISQLVTVPCYAVIVQTMLRYRLFRVRGVVADGLLYGTLSLICLTLTAGAGELIATQLERQVARGVCFAVTSLLPLGAWLLAERYARRLETLVLGSLDPRRRLLKTALEDVLHKSVNLVDAVAICELTDRAIASLCDGTVARWTLDDTNTGELHNPMSGPLLPRVLADYLSASDTWTMHSTTFEKLTPAQREAFEQLGADALVPVRGHNRVWCVFAITGEFVDKDTLDTAKALADNLGNKLAHYAMYQRAFDLQNQLETSRHLATLGSLTAAIAHEIRTPLTSIKMNLEMIRARPELDIDAQECADLALGESQRISLYVTSMLDYVKPLQLRTTELDVSQLVDEAARTLQPLLESRKLKLQRDFSDATDLPLVRADPLRLKQVLLNLFENAAEASAPGETISVVTEACGTDRVAIRVIDHGQGIEPVNLLKIFEPFFTTRSEGTGLGLAIAKKLVRAHHGDILVHSVVGIGSTFTVVLPI